MYFYSDFDYFLTWSSKNNYFVKEMEKVLRRYQKAMHIKSQLKWCQSGVIYPQDFELAKAINRLRFKNTIIEFQGNNLGVYSSQYEYFVENLNEENFRGLAEWVNWRTCKIFRPFTYKRIWLILFNKVNIHSLSFHYPMGFELLKNLWALSFCLPKA